MDDLIYIDLARSTSHYHMLLANALMKKLQFEQLRQIATVLLQQLMLSKPTYSILSKIIYPYYVVFSPVREPLKRKRKAACNETRQTATERSCVRCDYGGKRLYMI